MTISRKILTALPLVAALAAVAACAGSDSPESEVRLVADRFAEAYFNYDLNEALSYSDPAFENTIVFLASNLSAADLEAINASEGGARTSVGDVRLLTDSTAVTTVAVDNYVTSDGFASRARVYNNIVYEVFLTKRSGSWLVRKADLLQSGTHSPS